MKSQLGVSELIIFIAIIITAAIAAGVIIYTTQQLQQKALLAGSQAQSRVTTGVETSELLLYQYNYSSGLLENTLQAVSGLGVVMRLGPASGPINLGDMNTIFTTGSGAVYTYSATTPYPSALIGYEEGNIIVVDGFLYDNNIVTSANITQPAVCQQLVNETLPYVSVQYYYSNGTLEGCVMSLNSSVVGVPISLNQFFEILQQMNEIGVQAPFSILNLVQNTANGLPSTYLTNGEIDEVVYYSPVYLYPGETFELQIVPYSGYQMTIEESIPTVLQYSVQIEQS